MQNPAEDAAVQEGAGEQIPTEAGEQNPASTAEQNPSEIKRILEAALLASPQPLSIPDLKRLFGNRIGADTVRRFLDELKEEWSGRAVELASVASGFRFQTRADFQPYLERMLPDKPPRYSRAVMETLAIIAYRQPVTRGDIEDIRGVAVSAQIIQTLESRGWIDTVGHRDTPGRPAIYATTRKFLDDLGLRSLQELPPLEEIAKTLQSEPAANKAEEADAQPAETAEAGITGHADAQVETDQTGEVADPVAVEESIEPVPDATAASEESGESVEPAEEAPRTGTTG